MTSTISYIVKLFISPSPSVVHTGGESVKSEIKTMNRTMSDLEKRQQLLKNISITSSLKDSILSSLDTGVDLQRLFVSRVEAWKTAWQRFNDMHRSRINQMSMEGKRALVGCDMTKDISEEYTRLYRNSSIIMKNLILSKCDDDMWKKCLDLPVKLREKCVKHVPSSAVVCQGECPERKTFAASLYHLLPSQDFKCSLFTPNPRNVKVISLLKKTLSVPYSAHI